IQDTKTEEIEPKAIKITRRSSDNSGNIQDKEGSAFSQIYSQYLTVSDMGDVHTHPAFEWVYSVQPQVPFPVYISIRAEYQPNEMVKRFLSNIELETKDQREEAIKGEQNIDETDEKVESGARS